MAPEGELNQSVALVTGGAGGIGSAICRELGARGATVVCADLNGEAAASVASTIVAGGGTARGVSLDVTSRSRVEEVVEAIRSEYGAISVLVNNVGSTDVETFLESTEEFWDVTWEINLKSALRMSQVVLPGMIAARNGRVINISSDAGRVGTTKSVAYTATKGGVIALSKALAREVARDQITVNTVCPGPTDTPLLDRTLLKPEYRDAIVRAVPLKRLGLPEDIAAAVAFLASPGASFITGQTLSVSGGLTMA